jgi:hypothetical protein
MAVRQDTERAVTGAVVREKAMPVKAGLKLSEIQKSSIQSSPCPW